MENRKADLTLAFAELARTTAQGRAQRVDRSKKTFRMVVYGFCVWVVLSTVLFTLFEVLNGHNPCVTSWADLGWALYFTVVNTTTVGLGDISAYSTAGAIVVAINSVVGVVFYALLVQRCWVGAFSAISEGEQDALRRLEEENARREKGRREEGRREEGRDDGDAPVLLEQLAGLLREEGEWVAESRMRKREVRRLLGRILSSVDDREIEFEMFDGPGPWRVGTILLHLSRGVRVIVDMRVLVEHGA